MASNVEMRPLQELLVFNFGGYKLSFEQLSVYKKSISDGNNIEMLFGVL